MVAKALMIQGTMSSAGKSLLVTALCRIFARQGLRVAPFKAQNMSNNAAVCADRGEIGRAQFTQALAAAIQPTVEMNPILLKPEADSRSQVIVNGQVWETLPARNYYERKQFLWEKVTIALDSLRDQFELIIIEGAGSPVEMNLKRGDIVNMAVAKYAQSPVLLAGDIDRGGIFAQLLGTLMLFDDDEKALVKGLLVNKFRGDITLFDNGIQMLEERGNVPVLGVIPYVPNLNLPEEDAVAIEPQNRSSQLSASIDIAVIALPRIANFDDFDSLNQERDVSVRFVSSPDKLGEPSVIILPGTKSTISDLNWLKSTGLAQEIVKAAHIDVPVVGICGGYQMLGEYVYDPERVESTQEQIDGLGLLPITTIFEGEKATYQTQAQITGEFNWLQEINGETITGYEIHMGQTQSNSHWLHIRDSFDGAISDNGQIWGCYLHGLFNNENLRRAWLKSLGWQSADNLSFDLAGEFDRLADIVENALDMPKLQDIIGL